MTNSDAKSYIKKTTPPSPGALVMGELQVGDFVKFKDNPECTGTIFEVLDAIADRGVPLHNIVILLSLL